MIRRVGKVEYLLLKKDKHGEYLAPFIANRVLHENSNMIMLFYGKPRSGKSNACIKLAENLRDHYGLTFPDDGSHIAMGTKDFLSILKSRPPVGSVIIYEEAPVGHNSREWHSRENAMLNNILNTFGFMRHVWILNGVDINDLDSQARKLIYMKVRMTHKNMNVGYSYGESKWRNYDDEKKMFWETRLKTHRNETISKHKFSKCSPKIWELYEERKRKWNYDRLDQFIAETDMLYKNVERKMKAWEYEDMFKAVLSEPNKFITSQGRISLAKIQTKFDLKRSLAVKIKAKMEMEDIDWTEAKRKAFNVKMKSKPRDIDTKINNIDLIRDEPNSEDNKPELHYSNNDTQPEVNSEWTMGEE